MLDQQDKGGMMPKPILTLALFATLIAYGCSQQSPPADQEGLREAPAETSQPAEHSMTGCLQKGETADTFILTDDTGLRIAQISESTTFLAPHVGHKVEITGSPVGNTESHSMKVTALEMIASTCP
jgi:hypothetical protein